MKSWIMSYRIKFYELTMLCVSGLLFIIVSVSASENIERFQSGRAKKYSFKEAPAMVGTDGTRKSLKS